MYIFVRYMVRLSENSLSQTQSIEVQIEQTSNIHVQLLKTI